MAASTTVTRNLKLKIDSNLTANAKYNLERIDALGAIYLVDNTETVNLRSKVDINLRPADASVGGAGTGGNVTIGASGQPLTAFTVYASQVTLGNSISLNDIATGGNKKLNLSYKSDASGSVDTGANRNLYFDLQGADRSLVLGGNLETSGGSLVLNLAGTTSLTAPLSGTLSTLAGIETFTNKTINAANNTIIGLTNSNIDSSAGIAYNKLNLAGSLVNADISNTAAIAYSKLSLTNSITASDIIAAAGIPYSKLSLGGSILATDIAAGAGIDYTKLALTASIVNADISPSAAIARSKLGAGSAGHVVINDGLGNFASESQLSTARGGTGQNSTATFPTSGLVLTNDNSASLSNKSIDGLLNSLSNIGYSSLNLAGGIVNADVNAAAAIAYSKLNLAGGIVDADVNAGAAIAGTKIAPDFGNQVIRTTDRLRFSEGGFNTDLRAAQSGLSEDLIFDLPPSYPSLDGQVLAGNTDGTMEWVTVGGTGTVTSVALTAPSIFSVTGSPITTAGTLALALVNQAANTVWSGPASGGSAAPTFRSLVLADLPALTTDDISEGTNLYFTDERVDDRVNALFVAGAGITLTYDDTLNTFTVATTITQYTDEMAQDAVGSILVDTATIDFTYNDAGNQISASVIQSGIDHGSISGLADDDHLQYHTDARALTWLGTRSTTDLPEGSNLYFTNERVDDRVAALIQNGTGLTWTYDDTGNTFTGNVSLAPFSTTDLAEGTNLYYTAARFNTAFAGKSTTDLAEGTNLYFTDERAQDAVGTILTDSSDIDFTYNDGAPSISATIVDGSITNVKVASGIDAVKIANGSVSNTEFQYLDGVTSGIQSQIDGKQADVITTQGDLVRGNASGDAERLPIGTSGYILTSNGTQASWQPPASTVLSFKTDWVTGDGTTKTVIHSLGSTDVMVQVFDKTDGQTIYVDTIVRTDSNTVTLTASQAPGAAGWRVLILAI